MVEGETLSTSVLLYSRYVSRPTLCFTINKQRIFLCIYNLHYQGTIMDGTDFYCAKYISIKMFVVLQHNQVSCKCSHRDALIVYSCETTPVVRFCRTNINPDVLLVL